MSWVRTGENKELFNVDFDVRGCNCIGLEFFTDGMCVYGCVSKFVDMAFGILRMG